MIRYVKNKDVKTYDRFSLVLHQRLRLVVKNIFILFLYQYNECCDPKIIFFEKDFFLQFGESCYTKTLHEQVIDKTCSGEFKNIVITTHNKDTH